MMEKAFLLLLVFGTFVASWVHQVGAISTMTSDSFVTEDDSVFSFDPSVYDDSRPISVFLQRRWPNKTMPVKFVDDYPKKYLPKVYEAMDAINTLTCVRLTNATASDKYTAKVVWGKRACYSHIGYRNYSSGYQDINLHPTCFGSHLGTVIHEFIHSIGFHHQQVRADRDQYLTVHQDRISKDHYFNFRKSKGKHAYLAAFGLPYDYNSVMQYGQYAFSTNKGPVMTLKKKFQGQLGQRAGPSRSDIAAINRMYECGDGYYLGDDIPHSVPYAYFHQGFMAKKPKLSKAVRRWSKKMEKLSSQ